MPLLGDYGKCLAVFLLFKVVVNCNMLLRNSLKSCNVNYSLVCLKYDMVVWIDSLANQDRFEIVPGVQVVKDTMFNDTTDRFQVMKILKTQDENYLNTVLLTKIQNYIKSRSIKWNWLAKNANGELSETGRKKEKAKMAMMVGMMMMMMKGMMMSKTVLILGLLTLKAVITSAIALGISLSSTLKSMSNGSPKHTMIEVMPKPSDYSSYNDQSYYNNGGGGSSGGGGGSSSTTYTW